MQRPIQLCDATLSNLLLLQDFHDGQDEIPFDIIKKGTVCTEFRVRAHSCVHTSLSLSPPFFLCHFHAFWLRVRSLSRSLPLPLCPFLSLSFILFSVAFTLLAARALCRALSLSLPFPPLSPFVCSMQIHACICAGQGQDLHGLRGLRLVNQKLSGES